MGFWVFPPDFLVECYSSSRSRHLSCLGFVKEDWVPVGRVPLRPGEEDVLESLLEGSLLSPLGFQPSLENWVKVWSLALVGFEQVVV